MPTGILARYAKRLPAGLPSLTLGEGGTPLLALENLPKALGLPLDLRIWVKVEGANPTGSFKDRGMVVAVAHASATGARCVICASTGNTSAAAAAYAKRAGLACVVLIPAGKIAAGKLAQAVAYGANIVQINGNFDDAMRAVRNIADDGKAMVVNSINPYRLQGQKTAAFEIIEQLGFAPDYHALPVGNAGNITAYWIGYSEAAGRRTSACRFCDTNAACEFCAPLAGGESPPVMLGYQAAGAAPFVQGAPVANPETAATAIRIGNPQSYEQARTAAAESNGRIGAVNDDDILAIQRQLAQLEGIFCEPASAASLAGVISDIDNNRIPADARIVCTLTGNGLKDPDIIPQPQVAVAETNELPDIIEKLINAT